MVSLRLAILCVVVGATLGLLVPGEALLEARALVVGRSDTSPHAETPTGVGANELADRPPSSDLALLSRRIAEDLHARERDLGDLRREEEASRAELLRVRAGQVPESAAGPEADPPDRGLVASLARRHEAIARIEAEVRELRGLAGRLEDERDRVAVGERVAALRSSEDARRAVARIDAQASPEDVVGSMAAAGRVEVDEMGATLSAPPTGSWPAQKRRIGVLAQEAERCVREERYREAETAYTEALDRLRGFGAEAEPLVEAIGVRLAALRDAAAARERGALDGKVAILADRVAAQLEGARPDLAEVVDGCEAILALSPRDGFAAATLRALARRSDVGADLRTRATNALRWVGKPVGAARRMGEALERTDAALAAGDLDGAEAELRRATALAGAGDDVAKRRAAVEEARAALAAAEALRASLLRGAAESIPAALHAAADLVQRSPVWAAKAGLPRAADLARQGLAAAEARRVAELEGVRREGESVRSPDEARRFLEKSSTLPAESREALAALVTSAREVLAAESRRAEQASRDAAREAATRAAERAQVESAWVDGQRLLGQAPAQAEAKFRLVGIRGDAEQKALASLGIADAARARGDLEPSRRTTEFARALRLYESLASSTTAPDAVRAHARGWASVLHARFAAGYARAARTSRSSRTAAESRRHFEAARTGLAVLERLHPSVADPSTGLPWARRVRDELTTPR